MTGAIFPLAMGEEVRLLTAIVLGFLFGFALERGGFGNASKLAAQFYLYDMTVFKVMFTAILVAMVGLHTLAAFGLVDFEFLWINPTFLPSQIVGGLLLGAGFIMSGLCPGTAIVSAASGRLDGLVASAGIFLGTFLFALFVDAFPALEALYLAGSGDVSLLPALLGVPAPLLVLAIVLVAGLAFIGAEWVERRFAPHRERLELAPRPRPRLKLVLAGSLALVVATGLTGAAPHNADTAPVAAPIEPIAVAERIIARDPTLLILDVRADRSTGALPGAYPAGLDSSALAVLATAVPGVTTVVVCDEEGAFAAVPESWPRGLTYRPLRGGAAGWLHDVLTPAPPGGFSLADRDRALRQNQIAAYFSGATVKAQPAAPPPVMSTGGAAKRRKGSGC